MRLWPLLALLLPPLALAQGAGYRDLAPARASAADGEVTLPQYPVAENFLAFQVDKPTSFSFYVDAKSITVVDDGVLRYTLIAQSPEGVLNIDYEGMRCADREYRVYAYGRSDKTWSDARNSRWQSIRGEASNMHRAALYNNYFCSMSGSVTSAAEAIGMLRRGGESANPTTKY